jgi:hypothetical protein
MGFKAKDADGAIAALEDKKSVNTRQDARITSTLQYMKKLNLVISNKFQGDNTPLKVVEEIRQTLESQSMGHYGSTDPKSSPANSGSSILLTDDQHRHVWKGGMPVRSDGNNFIPELAAASCVVKAVPIDATVTLRIDSMAAIGAISRGALSERKRVERTSVAEICWRKKEISRLSTSRLTKEQPRMHKEATMRLIRLPIPIERSVR